MSFAIWRKCDFQIHSPRDPNWIGSRPIGRGQVLEGKSSSVTDDEIHQARAQWAKTFVDKCLEKGLQAIALTDHHEMVMVRYVKEEIENRKRLDPAFDLWLFPGMELTASGGRQCLILFDSDLPEKWWEQAQGKLGIEYASTDTMANAGPKVTQLNCSYPDIAKHLDELDGIRGKYIVLPNVSEGGNHTVLIQGHHADFRRMPYVGGYLDRGQTFGKLSHTNQTRLSGTDKTWSSRRIYPLPTSDSRSADYSHLGSNNTWIKLG